MKNFGLKTNEIIILIIFAVGVVFFVLNYEAPIKALETDQSDLMAEVIPEDGIVLPVAWGDLGKKMISVGVIDQDKFESLYEGRGGLSGYEKKLLYGSSNSNIKIDRDNAGVVLNLFWALGLSNKNSVLEEGPMQDPRYEGAHRFASTGGWTLAKGNTMEHYSRYSFVTLTQEQQALVEEVSKNIYRPCCENSTYFPDCNHGMAMLGLLELMASQGVSEGDMYKIALQVNSYWFPETYITISKYFAKREVSWSEVDPKTVLSDDYSGALGYRQIKQKVEPVKLPSGGGCGV